MLKSGTFLALLMLTATSGHLQDKNTRTEIIPTVSYCELIRNPNLYTDKVVRVHATWAYGFEMSALYDPSCLDRDNRAWFETLDEDQVCPATKRNFRKLKLEGFHKADVTVVGRLYSGARFGHENGYNYKFVVSCLESAKQISFDVP